MGQYTLSPSISERMQLAVLAVIGGAEIPEAASMERVSREALQQLIEQYPRLIDILRQRFEGSTLQEIGNHYGLSRERIRQILARYPAALKLIKEVQRSMRLDAAVEKRKAIAAAYHKLRMQNPEFRYKYPRFVDITEASGIKQPGEYWPDWEIFIFEMEDQYPSRQNPFFHGYFRKDLEKMFDDMYEVEGRTPSCMWLREDRYRKLGIGSGIARAFVAHWGSWTKACIANLKRRGDFEHLYQLRMIRDAKLRHKAYVQNYLDVKEALGHIPTLTELHEHGRYHMGSYYLHYDNYGNFLDKVEGKEKVKLVRKGFGKEITFSYEKEK